MSPRNVPWIVQVQQADPDHQRAKRDVVEYEFSTPGGVEPKGRTHEEGKRVFRGDPEKRGPYTPD